MLSPVLRVVVFCIGLQALPSDTWAENARSIRERYEATIREFERRVAEAKGDRRALEEAKQRLEARLVEQHQELRSVLEAAPTEQDLLVAIDIAERLGRSNDVLRRSDQLLDLNGRADAAIYAKLRALLSLGKLEEAQQHVCDQLRAVGEDSDYHSMCGLLLAALHEQGEWESGVDYGSRFLKWCGRKLRANGQVDVAMPVFLELFVTCAEKSNQSEIREEVIAGLLGAVRAAIDFHKSHPDESRGAMAALKLYALWHHLTCVSTEPDPSECDIEWFRTLAKVKRLGSTPSELTRVVSASVPACMSGLCFVSDLDGLLLAVRETRSLYENGTENKDATSELPTAVRSLRQLEKMIISEMAVRAKLGCVSDLANDVDWQAKPAWVDAGNTPMVVYVWTPAGSNPGALLTRRLREIRQATDIPLMILSPYTVLTGNPADDQTDRQKEEGAAVVRLANEIDREIAVACIEKDKLLPQLPAADFPQMYVIGRSEKIEAAVLGYDKLRLQVVRRAAQGSGGRP